VRGGLKRKGTVGKGWGERFYKKKQKKKKTEGKPALGGGLEKGVRNGGGIFEGKLLESMYQRRKRKGEVLSVGKGNTKRVCRDGSIKNVRSKKKEVARSRDWGNNAAKKISLEKHLLSSV